MPKPVKTIFDAPHEFAVPAPAPQLMSARDQHAAKQIARLLHKAMCDVHADDARLGALDAGCAIGAAQLMTWDIESDLVKARAILLCDAAYQACQRVER